MPGHGSQAFSKAQQVGGSRVARKQQRRTEDAAALKACYAAVDARDGYLCRVCGKRGSPTATTLLERIHRHHLIYRSRGGRHETRNVLSLCSVCHDAIHVRGELHLEGDADARAEESGRLRGVRVERLVDGGWVVQGCC